jgi:CHASE2 domain-containing sensor protein
MTAQSSTKSSALNLNSLPLALLASLAAAALILVLRFLGLFQPLELTAYDALLKSRPAEPLDERILVIKITEEDIQKYKYPLPDALLAKLLTKIASYQPQSIGIDIYRDKPEGELAVLPRSMPMVATRRHRPLACVLTKVGLVTVICPSMMTG